MKLNLILVKTARDAIIFYCVFMGLQFMVNPSDAVKTITLLNGLFTGIVFFAWVYFIRSMWKEKKEKKVGVKNEREIIRTN